MFKKSITLFLLLGLVLTVGACAGTDTTTTAPDGTTTTAPAATTTTAPAENTEPEEQTLSGDVIIDGSGTVFPLMAHIAEQYMSEEEQDVNVSVGRAGSSAGFKKYIEGETDLSDASRAIKQEEIDQLNEKGVNYEEDIMEIRLAYDGLTMVVNPENDWATQMTQDEIVKMYTSGAYRENDEVLWSDIREDWPEEPVSFFGPNENHGTYEFFYEVILEEQDLVSTVDLQQEYSTLVDLVSNDKNAIAFFGFGYYVSNTDKLTAVEVDFGEGPVAPSLDTIGETLPYAGFTRPVFTYVNLLRAAEKPQVLDFAKYVVETGAPQLASENGFAPLPAEMYEEYLDKLNEID